MRYHSLRGRKFEGDEILRVVCCCGKPDCRHLQVDWNHLAGLADQMAYLDELNPAYPLGRRFAASYMVARILGLGADKRRKPPPRVIAALDDLKTVMLQTGYATGEPVQLDLSVNGNGSEPEPDDEVGCFFCGAVLPGPPHRCYIDPCPRCGYAPD